MIHLRQFFLCLAAVSIAALAQAQIPPAPSKAPVPNATHLIPPIPTPQSPVDFFRKLLLMSPVERFNSLTNRTPESRALIQAKVREYLQMDPNERELRLRATEIRWYLIPLLSVPPDQRAPRLALIPKELNGLIQSRLNQWDILPPPLQKEFLANNKTLGYFAQAQAVPADPRQQLLAEQFNQILSLKPKEKKQILATLSGVERAQMEKTLQSFDQLPAQQRDQCLHNYAKFAGMSPAEQAEFLKNAESWSKMSPQERQAWRDLVTQVPLWPVVPAHPVLKNPKNGVATNH